MLQGRIQAKSWREGAPLLAHGMISPVYSEKSEKCLYEPKLSQFRQVNEAKRLKFGLASSGLSCEDSAGRHRLCDRSYLLSSGLTTR